MADIWALSDGAAGNRRQALALARALALTLADSPVREWTVLARAPWRWLAPRRLPGSDRAFGEDFALALHQPPMLAVGCGRQAALATRVLRARGSRVVQILDPRIAPAHWDALVVPRHDRVRGANVITTLGSLNAIDDRWLADGAAAFPALAADSAPRTLLLLGGPIAGVPLAADWWAHLADTLDAWLARDGGTLWVSGSRRTPAWLADAVRARYAPRGARLWFGDCDGENPYAAFLAGADRIIASPDSINLISEACATGVPVSIALGPTGKASTAVSARRHRQFIEALLETDRARPLQGQPSDWPVRPLRELPEVVAKLAPLLGL